MYVSAYVALILWALNAGNKFEGLLVFHREG